VGTWGKRPFENDSALDLAGHVTNALVGHARRSVASGDHQALRAALLILATGTKLGVPWVMHCSSAELHVWREALAKTKEVPRREFTALDAVIADVEAMEQAAERDVASPSREGPSRIEIFLRMPRDEFEQRIEPYDYEFAKSVRDAGGRVLELAERGLPMSVARLALRLGIPVPEVVWACVAGARADIDARQRDPLSQLAPERLAIPSDLDALVSAIERWCAGEGTDTDVIVARDRVRALRRPPYHTEPLLHLALVPLVVHSPLPDDPRRRFVPVEAERRIVESLRRMSTRFAEASAQAFRTQLGALRIARAWGDAMGHPGRSLVVHDRFGLGCVVHEAGEQATVDFEIGGIKTIVRSAARDVASPSRLLR
jgi:hypothetical protein